MTEDFTEKRRESVKSVEGNDDLLHEILLRLPAESLLSCKCVSKHWHSVISDPIFCSNHTRIYQKLSMLGAYYYFHRYKLLEKVQSVSFRRAYQSLPTLEFLNRAFNSEPVIIHASKGLFLCWFGDNKPLAVCNLTTQKFTQLPQHLPLSSFESHVAFSSFLHYDPKKSLHYKVVLLGRCYNDEGVMKYPFEEREEDYDEDEGPFYQIDIYSSENKTWKRKLFRGTMGDFVFTTFWNGAIHWMSYGEVHGRFEIDTETLVSNPLPHPIVIGDDDHIIRYFGECCERLFLIQIEQHDCEDLYVFEMDNNFCWNVKYSVDMMPIRTQFDEIFQSPDPVVYSGEDEISWKFCVLCMVKEEEKDDLSLLLALPGKIISYDLKTGTFEVLRDFLPREFFLKYAYNYAEAFHFISTLSPT